MVKVKITEIYDLSTKVDKMGIIGIHTPKLDAVKAHYPGLLQNHKFIKVDSCDIAIACASVLPADPLQIGEEAGSIAPQDMFNPILYTACSNDSFNTLMARIMNAQLGSVSTEGSVGNILNSIVRADVPDNDGNEGEPIPIDDWNVYYSILGSQTGLRKAMPQQGLEMTGLYPIVYQVVNTYGFGLDQTYGATGAQNLYNMPTVDEDNVDGSAQLAGNFRGPSMRMPAIPLHKMVGTNPSDLMEIPQTYVAMIITPPAKQHKLYYRMAVSWTFDITGLCALSEYGNFLQMNNIADKVYASDYANQSRNMDVKTESVDTIGADVSKIMESTR